MIATAGAAIFAAFFVPQASAGCGGPDGLQGPFNFEQHLDAHYATAEIAAASALDATDASIVGMWKVQFTSMGNTNHNPPIPDGASIDFGYVQWHSDGTELMNSGGHAPSTQNFCMGVWRRSGFATYQLNHFALSYDAVSGNLINKVNIREVITLDPSGNTYSGTFTIDIFDVNGNHLDHLAGNVAAQRITVDTTTP